MALRKQNANYSKLLKAGLIPKKVTLSRPEMSAIASLSDDELKALISVGEKLDFSRPLIFPDDDGMVKFF
jgi:hypothetical protein